VPEETKPREKFGSPHCPGSSLAPSEFKQTQNRPKLGTVETRQTKFEVSVIRDEFQAEANVRVKIETYFDGEVWCARGIGEDIFAQGNTLDELYQNIKEAVSVHYGEIAEPITILTLSEVKLANAEAPAS